MAWDQVDRRWDQLVARGTEPVAEETLADARYRVHVTERAAELGVTERDLAYTVAYRAACEGTPHHKHTAA